MFERTFQWTMRNGSRLLFAIAIVLALIGLGQGISTLAEAGATSTGRSFASVTPVDLIMNLVFGVLDAVALPLVGALLVHHLNQRT